MATTARTLPTARDRAFHEAAHAASLLIQGFTPKLVRTDFPSDVAGLMRVDWDAMDPTDPDHLRALLIAVLQGPASEGIYVNILDWPLDELADRWPHEIRRDIAQAIHLIERLGMDAAAFTSVEYDLQAQWRDPRFRALLSRITSELEAKELLLQPELQQIALEILETA